MTIKKLMKPGDYHLVVNGQAQRMAAFDHTGKKLWTIPCRPWGQHRHWREPYGDTPPGLYKCGVVYDTKGEDAYGPYCIDMIDLEDQETGNGRAGISLHGGGTGLLNPHAPYQGWRNTHGCLRVQNADLLDKVLPLVKRPGDTFITVVL